MTADWQNPGNGQSGKAGVVALSTLTGAFYFESANSTELMGHYCGGLHPNAF